MLSAQLSSLFLQAGAAAFLGGFWLTGYGLVSVGSTLLVARLKAEGILSNQKTRALVIAISAIACLVGGIGLYRRVRKGGFAPLYTEHRADGGSGKYRGVILWTYEKPLTVLRAPPPERGRGANQLKQAFHIPFDGVYWFFKFPDRQPPRDSLTMQGNPAAIAFRSADNFPLEMEARQNFATVVDLSCCSRVELEILNADRGPVAAWLELILVDGREPGQPVQSLGRQPVASTARLAASPEHSALTETLSFAIPESSRIREFDGARIRFMRFGSRSTGSARIGIEGFTLVPRGQ